MGFFWPFGEQERHPLILAGSAHQVGNADGVGRHARFQYLWPLTLGNERHMYVQAHHMLAGMRRLGRIDTSTDEARTCCLQGLDLQGILRGVCPAGDQLYILDEGDNNDNIRLLRASFVTESAGTAELGNWHSVDLTEPLEPLAFKLHDGTVLSFDARILKARSEYFEKMLASGCREVAKHEVDLTGDVSVSRASLETVLRFIATSAFLKSAGEAMTPEQLFEVRSLAVRYQLLSLKELVVEHMCKGLSTVNVLPYLAKVLGSGDQLECACWDLMQSKGDEILEQSEDALTTLIQECPALGTALVMRSRKRRRM